MRKQHVPHHSPKKQWWLGGLPLLVLALALTIAGIQGKLTTTHAATIIKKDMNGLVQLSQDPYTNTPTNLGAVYHQSALEPVSYAFGDTIVSTFQAGHFQGGGSTNLGWATSVDSGKHWKTGFLSGTTIYAGGSHSAISNASVAYDPAHRVWLIAYLFVDAVGNTTVPPFTTSQTMAVSHSLDGGFTWSAPVIVSAPPAGTVSSYDQPRINCDTSVHSPFYGHCYTLWNDEPEIDLSTSTDGGATWGAIQHSATPFNGMGGRLMVQPNGTVVVVTPDESDFLTFGKIVAFTSTDGGQSWGPTVDVSTLMGLPDLTEDAQGALSVVSLGMVGGSSTGSAAYLSQSTDGIHWTAPQTIIAPGGANIWYGTLALAADPQTAGAETHLGLTYYQEASTASSGTFQPFFISSTDNGQHWSDAKALSAPMPSDWFVPRKGMGDYISTVFSDGRAFPFFVVATQGGGTDPYHENTYTVENGIPCE